MSKIVWPLLIFGLFMHSINYAVDFDFIPTGKKGQIVKHKFYMLQYSEENEQPFWVTYELTSAEATTKAATRDDNFRPDPLVTTGSATLVDYKGFPYDRGHLAPAADMSFSADAMSESFFLSNMSPQEPSFNRGIWKKLEETVRAYAIENDTINIVTGPIFNNNKGTIGTNKVTIPGYYYKAIYAPKQHKMIAFVMPNEKSAKNIYDYTVTVDSLENITEIDFFCELNDSLENMLESTLDVSKWGNNEAIHNEVVLKGVDQPRTTTIDSIPRKLDPPTTTTPANPVQQNAIQPQCKAITSSGKQCQRKAEKGSNYCWQHAEKH